MVCVIKNSPENSLRIKTGLIFQQRLILKQNIAVILLLQEKLLIFLDGLFQKIIQMTDQMLSLEQLWEP